MGFNNKRAPLAVRLVTDFGFIDRTLSAASAILPISYYLKSINYGESFLTHHSHLSSGEAISKWLVRSILKGGDWGSGLDQLLVSLRSVLQKTGLGEFPVESLEAELSRRGMTLRFEREEIEELSSMLINDRRTFSFLSLLYPGMGFKNPFHIDHKFPASLFSPTELRRAGMSEVLILQFMDKYNRLPNLQILGEPISSSTQDKMPTDWAAQNFAYEHAKYDYFARHMFGDLPDGLVGLGEFYSARRQHIIDRTLQLIEQVKEQDPQQTASDSNCTPLGATTLFQGWWPAPIGERMQKHIQLQ